MMENSPDVGKQPWCWKTALMLESNIIMMENSPDVGNKHHYVGKQPWCWETALMLENSPDVGKHPWCWETALMLENRVTYCIYFPSYSTPYLTSIRFLKHQTDSVCYDTAIVSAVIEMGSILTPHGRCFRWVHTDMFTQYCNNRSCLLSLRCFRWVHTDML
jgi:hypothetical protein